MKFNDMIDKVRKGWQPTIDYTTGEQVFVPGYDDEPQYWNQNEDKTEYAGVFSEDHTETAGDVTIDYTYIKTVKQNQYDPTDYTSWYDIEVKSITTPLGTSSDLKRHAHAFRGDNEWTFTADFNGIYTTIYSSNIHSMESDGVGEHIHYEPPYFSSEVKWKTYIDDREVIAQSYNELLSYIERKDELLKDRDYDDEYDEFVNNLPDRIEQNGYDMYYNCADSDFITYLNNGECHIELTIFPSEDVNTGYFTIEEYDLSTMSWELVSEGDYISAVDLVERVKERLNDMPEGS